MMGPETIDEARQKVRQQNLGAARVHNLPLARPPGELKIQCERVGVSFDRKSFVGPEGGELVSMAMDGFTLQISLWGACLAAPDWTTSRVVWVYDPYGGGPETMHIGVQAPDGFVMTPTIEQAVYAWLCEVTP